MRSGSPGGLGEYLRRRASLLSKQEELLREFAERVAARLGRCTILLFGSRARGDHLPYSDFDVAVVVERAEDKLAMIEELREMQPRGLPLDLVVLEAEELADPLVEEMLRGSKVLHDSLGVEARRQGPRRASS